MTFLGVVEFLAGWTLISLGLGLIAAAIMRFGLHYKPPGDLQLQQLYPLPSGSMREQPDVPSA